MEKLLTFKMFGLGYFMYLLFALVFITLLTFIFIKKIDEKNKKIVKISILTFTGLFVLVDFVYRLIYIKNFKFFDNLPLNSFDVFFIILLILFFKEKKNWLKFSYLVIIPVSIYSLIFPQQVYLNMPTFSLGVVSYIFINIGLILYSILLKVWSEEDFFYKDILFESMDFVIIVASAHLINVFLRFVAIGLNANYFGTMGEDYDIVVGFLDNLIGIPLLTILPLILLLIAVQYFMIMPLYISTRKKFDKQKYEELIALGNFKAQQEYRNKKNKNKSQILVRGENKAKPADYKNKISQNSLSNSSRVVKTNNEFKNDDK